MTSKNEMSRSDLINTLIRRYGYGSYLEIGVNLPSQSDWNWPHIEIFSKEGVDPNPRVHATYSMTSDEFFEDHASMKYDIIFIDGLHHAEQVYKDITNSLKWLEEWGTIVVHDCNPITEKIQERENTGGEWSGDVWKAWVKLRMRNPDLCMFVVDTNYGCGVIQKGSQKLFDPHGQKIDYTYLDQHRKEMLNLISVRDFKRRLGYLTFFDRIMRKAKKLAHFDR